MGEHFIQDGIEVKKCHGCERILPVTLNYFFKDKREKDGITSRCRECRGYHFKPVIKEGYKICNKCGEELEINPDNFWRDKQYKSGFMGTCRKCMGIIDPPKPREGFKHCSKCGKELPNTSEYFKNNKGSHGGLTARCRECIKEQRKKYYEENKEWISEKEKQYYQKHKAEHYAYCRKYRQEHPKVYILTEQQRVRKKENDKIYHQLHKEEARINRHNYKAKKRQLPNTLTEQQWQVIKDYFDNKCCYCGKEKLLTQDHFIPVSKGGEYTHNNILPACGSCNSSKGNRNFFEWYPKHNYYSKKRERKLLQFLGYSGKTQQLALM